jgi:hypothetical protein
MASGLIEIPGSYCLRRVREMMRAVERKCEGSSADRLRRDAKFLITIDSENNVALSTNSKGLLNVVAVIGPTTLSIDKQDKKFGEIHFELFLQEAVLLEIGLWRTRPYHRAHNKSGVGLSVINGRPKCANLSKDQWVAVWPILIDVLSDYVFGRVSAWESCQNALIEEKSLEPFFVKVGDRSIPLKRGVFVCIDGRDSEIISEFLWRDIEGWRTSKFLRKLRKMWSWRLKGYSFSSYTKEEILRGRRKKLKEIADYLLEGRLPTHQLSFLIGQVERGVLLENIAREIETPGIDDLEGCKKLLAKRPRFSDWPEGVEVQFKRKSNDGLFWFELIPFDLYNKNLKPHTTVHADVVGEDCPF